MTLLRVSFVFLLIPVIWQDIPGQSAVSPYAYEGRVGNFDAFCVASPFASYGSGLWIHQQIHADLRGRVQHIRELGFRQGVFHQSASDSRLIELEVLIGDSSCANRNQSVLSRNFIGMPRIVLARKQVSLPDLRATPPSYPTPFTILLLFDMPWTYLGQTDLCYQITKYTSTSQSGRYAIDGAQMRDFNEEFLVNSGAGCLVAGRVAPMTHSGTARTYRSSSKHTLEWQAGYAPTGAPSTFLVGLTNPNRYWPTLCTFQYVDDVFLVLRMIADGSGAFGTPRIEAAYIREVEGLTIHSQAYSLNPQHPTLIPVSATNGGALRIPSQPPMPIDIASFWQQPPNPVQGWDNAGMITRFR